MLDRLDSGRQMRAAAGSALPTLNDAAHAAGAVAGRVAAIGPSARRRRSSRCRRRRPAKLRARPRDALLIALVARLRPEPCSSSPESLRSSRSVTASGSRPAADRRHACRAARPRDARQSRSATRPARAGRRRARTARPRRADGGESERSRSSPRPRRATRGPRARPRPAARRRCAPAAACPATACPRERRRSPRRPATSRSPRRARRCPATRARSGSGAGRSGSGASPNIFQRLARARKRSLRRRRTARATTSGSHWLSWLGTISSGPLVRHELEPGDAGATPPKRGRQQAREQRVERDRSPISRPRRPARARSRRPGSTWARSPRRCATAPCRGRRRERSRPARRECP